MKILIVSKCPTHPTTAGNRNAIISQANILQELGNEIHFLYIMELPIHGDLSGYMEDYNETKKYWGDRFHCIKVSKAEKIWFNLEKEYRNRFCHYFEGCDDTYPRQLTNYVEKLNEVEHFDACIVNYYYLTKLFEHCSIPKKAIFTHDCLAYKATVIGRPSKQLSANEEAKAMQRSPYIFAIQSEEGAYFQHLSPKSKVYNVYSRYDYVSSPITGNHNIVFLSGPNDFNVNGLKWFLKDIFPLIKASFSDAKLVIAGAICKVIKDLVADNPQIVLKGYVADPNELYSLGDVAINPTSEGTGLKIKTFEAISQDKVTMVHPHSTRGIYDKDNAPLFVSDQPREWVDFLKKVWANKEMIREWKEHNKRYMEAMNAFIVNEYKRFLRD